MAAHDLHPSTAPHDLRETAIGLKAVEPAHESGAGLTGSASNGAGLKELEAAINDRLARLLRSNIRLRIDVDEGTGDIVYKSIDKNTGEIDRQWPAETILRMLAFFHELDGLLYDNKF